MWYFFVKLSENGGTVTYSYGYESRELTGIFEFDLKTYETKVIKYAVNHTEKDQKAWPIPAYKLIKTYGAPDERMIAFG